MLRRLLLTLLLSLLPLAAAAQSVQQSGTVTPGHIVCWTTSGVVQDCGPATGGSATNMGFTVAGAGAFGINSGPITSGYTAFGLGISASGVDFTDTALGSPAPTHIPMRFIVNGGVQLQITDTTVLVSNGAHETSTGTAPVVSTGSGDCGTSPVIAGNDNTGRVTVGSSTNGGQCTVTFAVAWTNKPICTVANETSGARTVFPTPSTTALVIKAASTLTAADSLVYSCEGYQ